jgi:hypothetical protein
MSDSSYILKVYGLLTASALLAACSAGETPRDDGDAADDDAAGDDDGLPPLPGFVVDCDDRLNDDEDSLAGIESDDGALYEDLELCDGDQDWYRIDVPPGKWVSVELVIHGSGNNWADDSDLDLWQMDEDGDEIWWSATEQPYERLAWFNETDVPVPHFFKVDGYQGAHGGYDLFVERSKFHEDRDCDDAYEEEAEEDGEDYDEDDESGPCNRILQFPQAETPDDGYWAYHENNYSNLRREVIYLVRYATEAVRERWQEEPPLGLGDMSERDGDTPGTDVDSLRHPEGTHVDGNDIDIAYYQDGEDNELRVVCPQNDGYWCTGEPTLLDARRTAYFMAKLFESDHIRVIGVDSAIVGPLVDAARELFEDGDIDEDSYDKFYDKLGYGEGWPFHHHHMHVSWTWEDGWEDRSATPPPDGCMLGPELPRAARRR